MFTARIDSHTILYFMSIYSHIWYFPRV